MKNSLNECSKSGKDGMLIECIDAMGRMPWFQSFAGCQVASAKKNPSEAEWCTGCEAPGTPVPAAQLTWPLLTTISIIMYLAPGYWETGGWILDISTLRSVCTGYI